MKFENQRNQMVESQLRANLVIDETYFRRIFHCET